MTLRFFGFGNSVGPSGSCMGDIMGCRDGGRCTSLSPVDVGLATSIDTDTASESAPNESEFKPGPIGISSGAMGISGTSNLILFSPDSPGSKKVGFYTKTFRNNLWVTER